MEGGGYEMKKIAKYLGGTIAAWFLPLVVLAQAPGAGTLPKVSLTMDTITTLLDSFLTWAGDIIFILGVLVILYAAFLFMTSGGDEERSKKARSALIYGLIGVGVAILASTVFDLVASFF
jgi:phosphoglycerol transferase MdoB-like AlkP superfamily enzyme